MVAELLDYSTPVPERVLIAGLSARAVAESAARAGYAVTALDAFGDLDQHPAVRALAVERDFGRSFSPHHLAMAARSLDAAAVVYLSSFENHPGALVRLGAGRQLWGNPPEAVRRVRNPRLLTTALRRRGLSAPDCHLTPDLLRHGSAPFLLKPLASGGGHRIRPWSAGTPIPRGCYIQAVVSGTPASIVFAAAGGRAVPLGVSRQLIGEAAFGSDGFKYCGSILAAAGDAQFAMDHALVARACELGQAVAAEFGLVGVNGVDFVARDGVPFAVEVNPRWSASMELVERAYGLSVFAAHAASCTNGRLPAFDLQRARERPGAVGKAVVFARRDVTIGDTRPWLEDDTVRDVPREGERIRAGRPVCTVFATGADGAACRANLVVRAERVYNRLTAWDRPSVTPPAW